MASVPPKAPIYGNPLQGLLGGGSPLAAAQLNAVLAQQNPSAAWISGQQNIASNYRNDVLCVVDPTQSSMNAKLLRLSVALPMRLTVEIQSVSLYRDPLRIEVHFTKGKTIVFEDVDAFPSDEHIARIALECP
jgi:hypothetical protein